MNTEIESFISALPEQKKLGIMGLCTLIQENIPDGYQEIIRGDMICYEVPLDTFPDTYNKKPLIFLAVSPNKNNISLHMMNLYWDAEFKKSLERAFETAGKKLDMGKSCIRFQSLDDLPLDAISEMISDTTTHELVSSYKRTMANR